MGERKSDEELCREYEADQAYRRGKRLKAELTDILLAAQGYRKVGRPSAPVQEPTGADSKNPDFIARRSSPEFAVNRILTASSTLRWPWLAALARGPDAAFLVQRTTGHDLARLKVLHPDLRFFSSQGELADRIVEIPVDVPSTQLFDPHELESAGLLRIVKARLWEDPRTLCKLSGER